MVISRKLLKNVCDELKNAGKKIVFTNGCFDILHAGHIFYLNEAKKLGDVLIVGLNTDESVRKLKGETRPVNNETDRGIVLDALSSVDYVTPFYEDTPFELVSEIIPDVIVKGGDYASDEVVGGDVVTQNGGTIAIINFVEGKSTTNIINKMK